MKASFNLFMVLIINRNDLELYRESVGHTLSVLVSVVGQLLFAYPKL